MVPRVRYRNRKAAHLSPALRRRHVLRADRCRRALSQTAWLADVDQFFTPAVGRGARNIAPPLFTDDDPTFAPHVTARVA